MPLPTPGSGKLKILEAQVRGHKPGPFSFNVTGGRCEACRGAGDIIAGGTPEDIAACAKSYTGHYLKPILKASASSAAP